VESGQNRRRFLKKCTQFGFSCFPLLLWNKRLSAKTGTDDKTNKDVKSIDLKKRAFCGIACEEECELFKATKENNIELKKKVYEKWNWKKQFKMEFDPAKVFCYGCKPENNLFKIGIENCEVRKCATGNKIESCIQCSHLSSCELKFWKDWSDLYKYVKENQRQYLTQTGAALIEVKKSI
jgi:hypothetical protein